MRKLRTFDEVTEEYYRKHPEELDVFITVIFEAYANDGDIRALLSSLRTISRVKGITAIAEETGISRNGVQKALSESGNPYFESINSILHAIGYSLMPQKVHTG
jgi:probable addiction module antidote protein